MSGMAEPSSSEPATSAHPQPDNVLSNLITYKFMYKKIIKKYEWIEYLRIKLKVEKNYA